MASYNGQTPTAGATDAKIIGYALLLLREGLLASNLPGRLVDDIGITAERARRLAAEALKRWRAE